MLTHDNNTTDTFIFFLHPPTHLRTKQLRNSISLVLFRSLAHLSLNTENIHVNVSLIPSFSFYVLLVLYKFQRHQRLQKQPADCLLQTNRCGIKKHLQGHYYDIYIYTQAVVVWRKIESEIWLQQSSFLLLSILKQEGMALMLILLQKFRCKQMTRELFSDQKFAFQKSCVSFDWGVKRKQYF